MYSQYILSNVRGSRHTSHALYAASESSFVFMVRVSMLILQVDLCHIMVVSSGLQITMQMCPASGVEFPSDCTLAENFDKSG